MHSSTVLGLFSAVSIALLLTVAYTIARFIDIHFLVASKPLGRYKASNDNGNNKTWALITGASGGIGYGYAKYLLSRDFGVIILANTGVAEAEAKLLKSYPDASIKTFTIDCATATAGDIQSLVGRISHLPITILINNVGGIPVAWPAFRQFKDFEPQDIEASVKMNAIFGTHLTRELIPTLIQNARPRSLILNVASPARYGMPYMSMYCAAKGYVTSFSHTLTREFRYFGQPIDSLLIVPGDVLSDGNSVGMMSGAPLAEDFAKCALQRVDKAIERGMLELAPYWLHALQIKLINWLPEKIVLRESVRIAEMKREAHAKRR